MKPTLAILLLDWKGITRDAVLALNASLSVGVMLAITVIGALRGDEPAWARWFPALVALSLLTGPPSWGFLFGLLMVDEKDTGVRGALAVTPVSARRMLGVRSLFSLGLMTAWPLVSLAVMNATWRVLDVAWWAWLPLVATLALGAPLTALSVSAVAGNKVEAMALYKGINFAALTPLALYLVPPEAGWRWLFFALPSTWGLEAFEALHTGRDATGWLAGALAFHVVLLLAALRAWTRGVYKTA